MRVLVTGHLGYIGTILTPLLSAAGHDVTGLDSDLYARCTFGDQFSEPPGIKKDIRDVDMADLEGFDAIIHLAGLSNDPLGNLNPALTYEINHRASVRLARLARQAGVGRFLFSSSCSTYGATDGELIDEQADFNPVTPYGRSKVLVERDLVGLADDDFSPTFLRNATAYGVSPRLRFDLVLNNLVAWAATTGRIYLKSDGSPWRPLVHVEDIGRAFLTMLEARREDVHNQAFNVGGTQENYRIRELAEIVEAVVPESRIEYAPDVGPDKRTYRVNCDKFRRYFPDFSLNWNVRKGAQELYQAYQRVDIQRNEFEGPRYKRLAHLEMLLQENLLDESLRWIEKSP